MQIKHILVAGLLASAQAATPSVPPGDLIGSIDRLTKSISSANTAATDISSSDPLSAVLNLLIVLRPIINSLNPIIGQLTQILRLPGLGSAKASKRSENWFESDDVFERSLKDLMEGKRDFVNLGGVAEEVNKEKRSDCQQLNDIDNKICMDEFLVEINEILAAGSKGQDDGSAVQSEPIDSTAMPVGGGSISSRAISKRQTGLAGGEEALCAAVQGLTTTLQQLLQTILGKKGVLNSLLAKFFLGGILSTLENQVNTLLSKVASIVPSCATQTNGSSGGLEDILGQLLAILGL